MLSLVVIELKHRAPRVRFKHPVRVVPLDGSPRIYRTLAANLSRKGMFVRMPEPLPKGTRVALSLEAAGQALPFAEAEIVWCRTAESQLPGRYTGFGVRFTSFLNPRAPELVEYLVKNLDRGRPLKTAPARSRKRWRSAVAIAAVVSLVSAGALGVRAFLGLANEDDGAADEAVATAPAVVVKQPAPVAPREDAAAADATDTPAGPEPVPASDELAPAAGDARLAPGAEEAAPLEAAPASAGGARPLAAAPTERSDATEFAPTAAAAAGDLHADASPAGVVPTVVGPTVAAPTSAAPTSTAPTSAAPTSAAPTSAAPTSAAPTSAAPTSAAPVGARPTHAAPTAATPTDAAPTVTVPTVAAPTAAPFIAAPTVAARAGTRPADAASPGAAATQPTASARDVGAVDRADRPATSTVAGPSLVAATAGKTGAPKRSAPVAARPADFAGVQGRLALPSGAAQALSWEEHGRAVHVGLALAPGATLGRRFLLDGPPRLVVDLDGKAPKKSHTLDAKAPWLKQVRIGPHGASTRVVVDLVKAPSAMTQGADGVTLTFAR